MSNNVEVVGKKFNHWKVLQDLGDQKLLCECDCGKVLVRNKYSIIHGRSKSCGCDKPDTTRIFLTPGEKYNKLTVVENVGGGKVLCRCECGNFTTQPKTLVTSGRIKSCGCSKNDFIINNTVGQKFGRLTVIQELGHDRILCECECGNVKELSKYTVVTRQTTKSCGCLADEVKRTPKTNLVGQRFNDWVVLDELGNDKLLCRCSCGIEKVVTKSTVKDGRSKSCGHETNQFKDLTNQRFGSWVVMKELGHSRVQVQCDCGAIEVIQKARLLNGTSKSCGCKKTELMKSTLLSRYNEMTSNRISNPRESWQISAISNADKLRDFMESKYKGFKPTIKQVAVDLSISESYMGKLIHSYNLNGLVDCNITRSMAEDELVNFIKSIVPDGDIKLNSRQVIAPKEIDIYIPSKKIAIEFNGTYWHSSYKHPNNYHQLKSIECIKKGIRLIHIFEYEWHNKETKEKIKNLLTNVLTNSNIIVYARNTDVHDISSSEAMEFCEKYHLQGSAQSAINIGCYNNDNELIGVMTFGVPRFDAYSDYELIRLCWKTGISVVGGAEKMFKYFTDRYLKPKESIITYCDISKFDGNVYFRLGMESNVNELTDPGYVWVSPDQKEVLSRYQTQKHKLLDLGLGNIGRTEDEIMYKLGYYKVYNSGNLKFIYNK